MKNDSDINNSFLLPWLILLTMILLVSIMMPWNGGLLSSENSSTSLSIGKGVVAVKKQIPLLASCPTRRFTHHPCPLCGMTRAFVSAAHLDISYSARINPAGFFLFVYMVCYTLAGWTYLVFKIEKLLLFLHYNSFKIILIIITISWVYTLTTGTPVPSSS